MLGRGHVNERVYVSRHNLKAPNHLSTALAPETETALGATRVATLARAWFFRAIAHGLATVATESTDSANTYTSLRRVGLHQLIDSLITWRRAVRWRVVLQIEFVEPVERRGINFDEWRFRRG